MQNNFTLSILVTFYLVNLFIFERFVVKDVSTNVTQTNILTLLRCNVWAWLFKHCTSYHA